MPIIPNMEQNNVSLRQNKVFKIMSLFYLIIFLLSGLNLGFFRYKILPVKLVKLYSLIPCVILSLTVFISGEVFNNSFWHTGWSILFVTKYTLYVIYLILLNDDSSFFSLLEELHKIDSISGIHTNLEPKIMCSSLAWIYLRLSAIFLFCVFSKKCTNIVFAIGIWTVIISSELFSLAYTFMFFAVYSRFTQFIIGLKLVESDFFSQQCVYKLYVDTIEKYKKAFDPVILISLCFQITDIMLSFYSSLKEWRYHTQKMELFPLTIPCVFVLLMLMITLIPAVIAGMLSSQAKIITWILHEKLMQERDERAVWEIQRFISYVEVRGCQFRVYGIIPLDASLVGIVISFCVTYLIVIIEFTKLY